MSESDSLLLPGNRQKRRHQFARKLLYRSSDGGPLLSVWDGAQWQSQELDECPDAGLFGKAVLVLAAQDTLFRKCSFPADIVSRDNIDEAVRLDLMQWSPWADEAGIYYIPIRTGDKWDVSVWVWEREREQQLRNDLLALGNMITHVMPEDAWMAAAMDGQARISLTVYQSVGNYRYMFVNQAGVPVAIAWVKNDRDAKLFLHGLGAAAQDIAVIGVHEGINVAETPWLPKSEVEVRPMGCPSDLFINRGGLPGIVGWQDPMAWKPLLAGLAVLAIMWMLGSYGLLWSKQQTIDAALLQARAGGEEVLHARKEVDVLALKLSAIDALETQQTLPVLLLNELSHYLPKDVWLQSLYLRSGILEIKGQGLNAASLAGMLEKMPLIKRTSYIGDIRSVPNSDQHFFGMALYLKGAGQ